MTIKAQDHFVEVPSLSVSVDEWVIPNGEIWRIKLFQGSAAYVADTTSMLVWDHGGAGETVLRSTHGDAVFILDHELTGDGSKKLAIVLDNQSANAQTMGGSYEARK